MKRIFCLSVFLLLAVSIASGGARRPDVNKVRFEITRFSQKLGSVHWRIENDSDDGIYVFNFFLLGPAYHIERSPGKWTFETAPVERTPGCPPNRVAPIALLFIRAGGMIEGEFVDPEISKALGKKVSLKIAVGSEPETVAEEAKRLYNSNCAHSPYDAIVNWASFLESNAIMVRAHR